MPNVTVTITFDDDGSDPCFEVQTNSTPSCADFDIHRGKKVTFQNNSDDPVDVAFEGCANILVDDSTLNLAGHNNIGDSGHVDVKTDAPLNKKCKFHITGTVNGEPRGQCCVVVMNKPSMIVKN